MNLKEISRNRDNLSNIGVFVAFLAFSFLSFSLVSPIVSSNADTNNASVEADSYVSSISVDSLTSINITPTSAQSAYTGTSTISYTNTCPYGFNVTMTSTSDNTSLTRYGADSATKEIPSTTTTSLSDNTWGVSMDNGSTYIPIPSVTATPVNVINTFEATTDPATLNLIYGLKTDNSFPSGSYTNDLIYTVSVKPQCLTYDITWDLDGGTAASDVTYPAVLNFGTTINLSTLTPTKEGYEFTGWSNGTNTFDGTETAADINPDVAPSLTMTAQWEEIPTMQKFSCSSLSEGETASLTDTRDGNIYTVQKLKDGNCWMTDNLRLINKTISSADSNLPYGETYTIPASDASSFTESYNTNSAYLDSTHGGYYNFYTATAGWGTDSVASGNSPKDICPKGWRLPTGGSSGEFQTLYSNYNSPALMQGEPNFTLPGVVYNGSVRYQGGSGYFWSSTVNYANSAYNLNLDSSNVNPANNYDKYNGFSVRCMAKDYTMQTFDEGTMIPDTGYSMTLRDERDDNMYTVRRLADGNVWMTENLRLINKAISGADSNLPEGETYTVPTSSLSGFTQNSFNIDSAYLDPTYGAYYNFYTATAGTGGTNLATDDTNAPSSICPKGWRLPTGDSPSEFQALYSNYNSSALMQGVPNFTLSGKVDSDSSVRLQGSEGQFWSSTVSNAYFANYLDLTSSDVKELTGRKHDGLSIRCVAEERDITMQTFDESTMIPNVGDSMTLRDERDDNMYTVKRLADGNVWMTENLRLIDKTISSADSNLTSGETWTVPASDLVIFAAKYDRNAAYLDSTYGGYYPFYTATAGTGGTSLTSGDAPSSICPKGWHLPTGNTSGEFQTLYNNYNSSALMQGEPNFTFSGYVYSGSVSNKGSYGNFWSSTVLNANYAYHLSLNNSSVDTEYGDNKYYGFSVRCVAEDTEVTEDRTISDITYMQDMTSKIVENTPIDTVATLTDTRDNNTYIVRKLKDSKIWMTQNLRLIDKTISSADSNLPSGETYTVPASDVSSFTESYNTNSAYLDSTYGGYYNFYTATAGWGTDSVTSGNSPKDICPKGWRLPTGGDSSEFQTLYNNYNSSALMQGDPNFVLSGNVSNGSVSYQGSSGSFWSSTVYDANYARLLFLNNSDAYPVSRIYKYRGLSVRCMAI